MMDKRSSPGYAPLMPTPSASLVRDLVGWLAAGPKPYAEVMEAWRTSCPRLTIWEDAVDEGLVVRRAGEAGVMVELTAKGQAMAAGAPARG